MKLRRPPPAVTVDDWYCTTTLLLCCRDRLTDWEYDWLKRLKQQGSITDRKRAVLATIERAVRDGPEIPSGTTPAIVNGVPGLVVHSRMLSNGRSADPRFIPVHDLPKPLQRLLLKAQKLDDDR
jgi:hypothetical protein